MQGAEAAYLAGPDARISPEVRRSTNIEDWSGFLGTLAKSYINNFRNLNYIAANHVLPRVSSYSGIPRPPQMPAHPMQVPEAK